MIPANLQAQAGAITFSAVDIATAAKNSEALVEVEHWLEHLSTSGSRWLFWAVEWDSATLRDILTNQQWQHQAGLQYNRWEIQTNLARLYIERIVHTFRFACIMSYKWESKIGRIMHEAFCQYQFALVKHDPWMSHRWNHLDDDGWLSILLNIWDY